MTRTQVETLNKAVSAALVRCQDVSLRLLPGVYHGVQLAFDDRGRSPGCDAEISIEGTDGSAPVVFDGEQSPKFVNIVTHRTAFPGTIRNVQVQDYKNGIVVTRTDAAKGQKIIWANYKEPAIGSGGLLIRNVVFRHVGSRARSNQSKLTGWGAIIFNLVGNNHVHDNRFEDVGNNVESHLMHSIYLMGSSQNIIERNYFGAMEGAAIKLRNRANSNRIIGNHFIYGGDPLIQLWFCNQSLRGSKNCPFNECPSRDTVLAENRITVSSMPVPLPREVGGAIVTPHPFVSYEGMNGFKLIERFYVAKGVPKSCGQIGAPRQLLMTSERNVIEVID